MNVPRLPLTVLVGWTILLWVSRLRNVLRDDDLSGAGVAWRVAVVVVFVGLAGAVIVAMRTGRPPLRETVSALVGWTVAFWLVRGTGILLDDHDTSFKVVHTVLMVVSIGVAAWAARAVLGTPSPDTHPGVRAG